MKIKKSIEIINRKARYEYAIIETEVAGIVLSGTEIKSIRQGKASLVDSYCYIDQTGEIWLKNSHIARYDQGTYLNHEERRDRKLLLTRKQLRKFSEEAKKTGQTIIPLKLFVDGETKGKCKILIAIAKGKRLFDKRQAIKENEAKREMSRAVKNF